MDPSIVDTTMTSRKRKREEYKKIILLAAACVVHMVIGVVTWYHNNYFVKEPTRNWELERHSFLNRLYKGTNKDCIEQLRLSKNAFFNLCRILQENGGLVRTRNVPTTEAVTMFLHILDHNLKYRVMQFSYCRSKETISRQFNDVLRAVMKVSKDCLNFQLCTLEGPEANKWRWFEVKFLSVVDEELVHQSREGVQNNVIDDITTIQATEEWTRFQDTLAMNMFANYQEKIMRKQEVILHGIWKWLTNVLRDQRNLGNKGDGAAVLSTSFNVNVTSDNVKNHIKLWRSWYGIVSDILGQGGFDWDDTKHMITVENENAWNEYCTSHKSAKPFRFKVLQDWDDIKKMDGKVDDEDIQEVLRETTLIQDLNRQQLAKAIKWLADDPKPLATVKALPIHQKDILCSSTFYT
ncbi:hypothetical protein HKD37_16G045583 [Glycine soja]